MGAKLERQSEAGVTVPSTVTVIEPADAERAIATIVLAFSADPATRWTYADPHRYLDHFPAIVRAFGGRAFAHRTGHQESSPPIFPMLRAAR